MWPWSTNMTARIPSHLTSYPQASVVSSGDAPVFAFIGAIRVGERLVVRVLRRIHAVDHPVVPAGLEQRVLALDPLAVEDRDHLVLAELLGLVGARGPRCPSCPAPYWPFGISPWKSRYSSGWSSVCTASRFSSGWPGIPRGSAQEASAPSCSSRRSQCSRVASCCWTTKRAPVAAAACRRAARACARSRASARSGLASWPWPPFSRSAIRLTSSTRFLGLLRGAGIELLVDVRRYPSSRRFPWFNGPALAALPTAGIDYGHEEAARRPPQPRAGLGQRRLAGGAVPRLRRSHGVGGVRGGGRSARRGAARGRASCAPRRSGGAATAACSRTPWSLGASR